MGWSNLIFGAHAIHNFTKSYVNFFNAIANFVEPTPSTSIITNETILAQYSIKQDLRVFFKMLKLRFENNYQNSLTGGLLNQISPVISFINN